jgi:hypothetical protein
VVPNIGFFELLFIAIVVLVVIAVVLVVAGRGRRG